jgi:hypothetical protein
VFIDLDDSEALAPIDRSRWVAENRLFLEAALRAREWHHPAGSASG